MTRSDAAPTCYGEEHVPRQAITMGVGTIRSARKIYLMAWGAGKASIIRRTLEGENTDQVRSTHPQEHENLKEILDEPAAVERTDLKAPTLAGRTTRAA